MLSYTLTAERTMEKVKEVRDEVLEKGKKGKGKVEEIQEKE